MISDKLKQELKEKGQFPYGKRNQAYQTIGDIPGVRDMEHRYEVIKFPKSFEGETVIDFGCSVGAICFDAKKRGAKRVVGLDYKSETIEVAKKLAVEQNLDVEFYTFNIDNGLDSLKSIIGKDKFDHVFALSIWAHCDETKLAKMINHYTDKICWFEGHNTITYGDTKSKMDTELSRLLDLPFIEHIGETSDRSVRQNYKISRSHRVDLGEKENYVYFSGNVYDTVKESNHDYPNKQRGGNHLKGTDSFGDGMYNFNGKYSCYVADEKDDYGYKILNYDPSVTNIDDKIKHSKNIFKIQSLLADAGFSPKPIEILDCHDSHTFYHTIKMENLKGKFVKPNEKWIKSLVDFCEKNNITRDGWDISSDCVPKNCIEVDGKVYLVDIDYKWKITNA